MYVQSIWLSHVGNTLMTSRQLFKGSRTDANDMSVTDANHAYASSFLVKGLLSSPWKEVATLVPQKLSRRDKAYRLDH